VHWASPFRPVYAGREGLRGYLLEVFADEIEPTVAQFAAPTVNGAEAAVEYWARCHYASGPLIIAGCTILRFTPDGLVAEARDYSFVHEGDHPIPDGFSFAVAVG
jgi:hypothetical protein